MSQTADEADYSTLVTRAADGLYVGYLSWDDIELPDAVDAEWQAFKADVEQKHEEIAARRDNEDDSDGEDDAEATGIGELDWSALWEEFGFDTRDAAGCRYASKTQLIAAIESTDQGYSGDAMAAITTAVDDGPVHCVETTAHDGTTTLRGYVLGDVV
jgi:hypothetical protein